VSDNSAGSDDEGVDVLVGVGGRGSFLDAGLASGLVNTSAQIGGALGLAVLATVSTSRTNTLLAQHTPAAAALTGGYHLAFWIACGLVITSHWARPEIATTSPQ
jgi:hypothetical protein